MTQSSRGSRLAERNPCTSGPSHPSHPSHPSLARLRRLAAQVAAPYPHGLPYGLTRDDLVHEGWLAWCEQAPRARTASHPYARARYAMLEAVRRWRDSRSGSWAGRRGETIDATDWRPDDWAPAWNARTTPVRQHRLRRGDIAVLRGYLHRTLSARQAALCERVLIDGEDVAIAGAAVGYPSRQHAVVARARAYDRLRQALPRTSTIPTITAATDEVVAHP